MLGLAFGLLSKVHAAESRVLLCVTCVMILEVKIDFAVLQGNRLH